MKAHYWQHLGGLIGLCMTLAWQAPSWAASRHDLPVVVGPDAQNLSQPNAGKGPLVMYVGNAPSRRWMRATSSRQARHARSRRVHARFADANSNR